MSGNGALGARAEQLMDSDAPGFTTDDPATALRMYEKSEFRVDAAHSEDDDDDIGVDFYPSPKPPPPQPIPTHVRSARHTVAAPQPAPPPRPAVPAPVVRPAERAVRPEHARMPDLPTPMAGRSASPFNDEEDGEPAYAAPPVPVQHRSQAIVHADAPRAQRPPAIVRAATSVQYSIATTPQEALARYDESMTYLVEILCQLTGNNTNAETAKSSLEIFRNQMHAMHGDVSIDDWQKACTSMAMFSETVQMVIHTTVQRAKEQRVKESGVESAHKTKPIEPRHDLSAPARMEREPTRGGHEHVMPAIPRAIPTDAEPADHCRTIAPIGMKFNNPVSHQRTDPPPAEPARAGALPPYIAQAESAVAKTEDGGCRVM